MSIAFSQPTDNTKTITIPIGDALKVLAAADSAKVHKQVILALRTDIDLLEQRIRTLQQSRDLYRQADSLCQQDAKLAEQQMLIMQDQKRIAQSYIDGLKKINRKQKRKTFWTAISGVVTTTAAIFIFK